MCAVEKSLCWKALSPTYVKVDLPIYSSVVNGKVHAGASDLWKTCRWSEPILSWDYGGRDSSHFNHIPKWAIHHTINSLSLFTGGRESEEWFQCSYTSLFLNPEPQQESLSKHVFRFIQKSMIKLSVSSQSTLSFCKRNQRFQDGSIHLPGQMRRHNLIPPSLLALCWQALWPI